jgi:hypothetical protein
MQSEKDPIWYIKQVCVGGVFIYTLPGTILNSVRKLWDWLIGPFVAII